MKKKPLVKRNELKILIIVVISVLLITLLSTSYAMFNYSRTSGNSSIETGTITFNFTEGSGNLEKGNVFPIEESDIDNTITRTFSITAHSDYSDGIRYKVYVVYGDNGLRTAIKEVKDVSDYICSVPGGAGAVREFIDWLLEKEYI